MKTIAFLLIPILFLFQQIDAQEKKTPLQYIEQLMQGNYRFSNDKLEHPNRTSERREALTSSQAPFAVVVCCSDSRVSPEIVFDQGIGDLFVVRLAGNIVGPIGQASIDYGVEQLGASVIFVLGHEGCGAVQAVLEGKTKGIEPIATKIDNALHQGRPPLSNNPLENAVKLNVQNVVADLSNNPVFAKLIEEKKLLITGGYYVLSTGKVELCCEVPKK